MEKRTIRTFGAKKDSNVKDIFNKKSLTLF